MRALPVALVPIGSSTERCLAEETLAAELDAAGIPVIRAPVPEDEPIEAAMARTGSDLALSGRAELDADGRLLGGIVLAIKGSPAIRVRAEDLRKAWPKDLPPLARLAVRPAPSEETLAALCKGDPTRAYQTAGAALGLALGRSPPPRGSQEVPLAIELASGWALDRAQKLGEAIGPLSRALERFKAGEVAPTWRSPPPPGLPTSKISMLRDLALGFTGGRFRAIDPLTGALRWVVDVGRAEPVLVDAGNDLLVALEDDAVTGIDASSGLVRFRVPAKRPFAEVASYPDRVIFATDNEVVGVDRLSGAALFRLETPVEISAGPVRSNGDLAIPAETEVLVLDPKSGGIKERLDLGDEVSAPLFVLGTQVYAVIGADRVGRLGAFRAGGPVADKKPPAPAPARLDRLATELFAVRWPPTPAKSGIALAYADKKKGPGIALLEGEGTGPAKILAKNLIEPQALDEQGFAALERRRDAIVILDGEGKTKQRVALPGPARSIALRSGELLVAVGPRVFSVAPASGKRSLLANIGEPIRELVASASVAVALGESGAMYGIPRRDHPVEALAELRTRIALSRALNAAGRAQEAEAALPKDSPRVDVLLARTEIALRREGPKSAAALLTLTALPEPLPEARALAEKARLSLGFLGKKTLPGDIASLSSEEDRVAAELPGFGAVGVDPSLGIVWQRRGTKTASSALGPIVDGAVLDPRTGAARPEPRYRDRALELATRAWPKGPMAALARAACAGPICAVAQGKNLALLNAEGAPRPLPPAVAPVKSLAVSSDGRFIVALLEEGAIDAFDLKAGRWRGRIGLAATAVTISTRQITIARGRELFAFDVARGLGLAP
ncbi:MAG: PQQ-binding-like beta-propeller repeat protein [Myxococcota bacterium]